MKGFPVICSLFVATLFLARRSSAFVAPAWTTATTSSRQERVAVPPPLFAEPEESAKKEKRGGLDESVRTKLVSESIAPWRTLRLFLYGALGSGAFIGGLVTLTGTAAILAGNKEGDINTEVRHFKAVRKEEEGRCGPFRRKPSESIHALPFSLLCHGPCAQSINC